MLGPDAYQLVKKDPSELNKMLFLLYHKPFISTVVYRYLRHLPNEVADITSDIYLILLKRGNLDFKRSYQELKGYMALTAQRQCDKYRTQEKYHQLEIEMQDFFWNNQTASPVSDKLSDMISGLRKGASKQQQKVIDLYLEGYTTSMVTQKLKCSKQYISFLLRNFGKRRYGVYRKIKEAV